MVLSYSAPVMPLLAWPSNSSNGLVPSFSSAALSCAASALKAAFCCHSGCCGAAFFTWSSMNRNWKYSGCSAHRAPSLSNAAMRSAVATKFLPFGSVTACTNATMPDFAAPSFHDGNGACAHAPAAQAIASANVVSARSKLPRRMQRASGGRLPVALTHHQPEADVRHRVVRIVAAPRARPVTQAVLDVAEERATARDAFGRVRRRITVAGVVAVIRSARVVADTRRKLRE